MKAYQEIKFRRDTAFRKQFFVPDSFAHPAKMDSQLLIWIVERYTKQGETILDPMAGMGTMMLACGLGRNVVLVELEGKFCKMMQDNWAEVRMRPQLGYPMGTCQIIQGDARQLEGLLVDKCIFSPPFADQPRPSRTNHGILNHKPDCKCNFCRKNRGNKGAIQGYRQVDKCIFSPPYADSPGTPSLGSVGKDNWGHEGKDIVTRRGLERGYSKNTENQIGNLPYGSIDKIVTSPPYAGSKEIHDIEFLKNTAGDASERVKTGKAKGHYFTKEARERALVKKEQGLIDNPNNLGNLPYGNIDAVVSSPPYEGSVSASTGGERDQSSARQREARLRSKGYDPAKYQGGVGRNLEVDFQYSKDDDNIGNLKNASYLEAMLQVYAQCWGVLKDSGLMILVTKNFIRNKQVVRLDTDTIKLCEQAGFTYLERHYRKLSSQSFWRIIYHQKHPEVEQILHEDVLVFRKVMELKV